MGTKLFRIFYITLALALVTTVVVVGMTPGKPFGTAADNSPESVMGRIQPDDIALRSRALEISARCPDKECSAYKIFNQILKSELFYENADETEKTVLFASYLMNIDIPVQVVFTDSRPYALACGLDRERLYEYILADKLSAPLYTDRALIAGGQVWMKALPLEEPSNIVVSVNASASAKVYILDSVYSLDASVADCEPASGVSVRRVCAAKPGNALAVAAPEGDTRFDIVISSIDATAEEIPQSIYRNKACIPFDFGLNGGWLPDKTLNKTRILEAKR